ncbi:MAG: MFS transporter [Sphingomonadales bacterium]|nr:MFS transporter [Sphingomonadales bacterium]
MATRVEQRATGAAMASRALVAMLALALFINSLDRGNFSTAAPLIKDQLRLTNSQIGVLISAFFWTYVPGHFLSGWLSERINAYRTLTLGLLVWSAATLLTGLAEGFAMLLALRLLLGLGESAGWPASSKLLSIHVPGERLASANAMTGAGLMLGNGVGILLGGLVIAQFGWRTLFFVFGAVSLMWLVPWLRLTRSQPQRTDGAREVDHGPAPAFRVMLSKREMWGAALGHFCNNYPYFLVLSWLPLYLVKQQGYSLVAMAWLGGAVYFLSALFGVVGARMTDRRIARGDDPSRVRKTVVLVCLAVALGCMLACALGGPRMAVAGLLAFSVANGLGAFSVFSIGQALAGPRCAGKWIGIQNGVAGLSGVVGPLLTGWSIDLTGSYRFAFLLAAAIVAGGMVCWGLVVRRVEPLDWGED